MPLTEYRRKRRFSKTPEPKGATGRKRTGPLKFVVQKHDATRLHYDFRLEFDGVLKSWAVPKGPSLDPADKRLAVQVEDHPLEYGNFEGKIPEGEYGGGTVMLWDCGVWQPLEDAAEGFRTGKLKFVVAGKKLQGAWMLVRLHSREGDRDGKNWLLIKERDQYARPSAEFDVIEREPDSVKSKRSMEQIANANGKVWNSKRPGDTEVQTKVPATSRVAPKRLPRTATRLTSSRDGSRVEQIAGVRLTHPDRVLFPNQKISKRDLAEYYIAVADWMLPHLKDRPLSLLRCPEGQGKKCFYQKHPGVTSPPTLDRVEIREKGKFEEYAVVNDVAGLVSLVQMGVLEIHPWGSRTSNIERPDRLIFDLDPDEDVPWPRVIKAANQLRELLEELDLKSFLKTTGGKGLHLVVPIDRRREWPEAKEFARNVVNALASLAPDEFTTNMSKARRRGRIYLDYLRNDRGSTAVAPYSTRARPGAPVSTPIDWKELTPKLHSDEFDVRGVIRRLTKLSRDPWGSMASTRQSITAAALKRLG